ncbi:MAG: glycoside hydrolase family 2 protein [Bacillota bacterium]
MSEKILLNGEDWQLTGWWKNQWKIVNSMETGEKHQAPVSTIPAKVPGAVQVDLFNQGILEDPDYGLNSLKGEWVNNREWIYDKEFEITSDEKSEKYFLIFKGLDYSGEIYLNKTKLTEFKGMFRPVEVDVTGLIKFEEKNHLQVVFYQTPEVDGQFGYSNQIEILKSRFNYIWDWCPRIIPVGLWDDVYIKTCRKLRIRNFFPETRIEKEKKGIIDCNLNIEVYTPGEYEIEYQILFKGKEILKNNSVHTLKACKQNIKEVIGLEDIELWWPAGHGEQPLYEIKVIIYKNGQECDSLEKRVGFRNIEFKHNKNSPANARPYTLYVNGKRIFVKGINWVPLSPFYGNVTKKQYKKYLTRFKNMNCNLIRVWGGAILEKKFFYDLCDELGLMVWQEFPQSSSGINNTPPDNPEYLQELKKVAEIFIKRMRHHPSHIIWCGGNELMWEEYKPVDETHLNIKMLKELVEKMDKTKYFLPTSASGPRFTASKDDFGKGLHHDVHGPWGYKGNPDHYQFFNQEDSLFRSETGSPGISRWETLKKYKKNFKIWPPDNTNPYWSHRGSWWIQLDELNQLCGEWDKSDIKKYISMSRFLQAEALRYGIESMRRREPETSGFLIWMGNEPFPNNANNSVIEYDGTPKPAYHWIKKAYSNLHITARYNRLNYNPGDKFKADLFLVSNSDKKQKYDCRVELLNAYGRTIKEQNYSFIKTGYSTNINSFFWKVEELKDNIFFIRLKLIKNNIVYAINTYIFTTDKEHPLRPLKKLDKSHLTLNKNNGKYYIKNESNIAAAGVFIYSNNSEVFIDISPGYITLMPGEKKKIQIFPEVPLSKIAIEKIN